MIITMIIIIITMIILMIIMIIIIMRYACSTFIQKRGTAADVGRPPTTDDELFLIIINYKYVFIKYDHVLIGASITYVL